MDTDAEIPDGTDDRNGPDFQYIRAPRAASVLVGLLVLPLAVLFGIVGISLLESVWKDPGLDALSVGLGSLWAAWFTLSVSWRLVSGRMRRDGGLLSPPALRAAACLLIAMPVIALILGSLRLEGLGWLRLLQIAAYLLIARALFRLASQRSA